MITKMSEGSGTIVRRNLPGTKTSNFSKWPEESFDEMDSTLAVQQYIQQTIRKDPQGNLVNLAQLVKLSTFYWLQFSSAKSATFYVHTCQDKIHLLLTFNLKVKSQITL